MKTEWCHFNYKISYPVYFGRGVVDLLGHFLFKHHLLGKVFIITNPSIWLLHGAKIRDALQKTGIVYEVIAIPEGEEAKNLKMIETIYNTVITYFVERSSTIIAFGGGVVGDAAGYAAATLLRGLPLVQVPTTLIGLVDSSIGGKVGIDHPLGKNLIGSFCNPKFVLSDFSFLDTLPQDEWRGGMAEVVKSAIIGNPSLLKLLEQQKTGLETNRDVTESIVVQAAKVKIEVVNEDPYETGKREILNLGHTFGHALEQVTYYQRFRHGEAVGIGIAAACRLGCKLDITPKPVEDRIKKVLAKFTIPISFPLLDYSGFFDTLMRDKKCKIGKIKFVVPKDIGKIAVVRGVSLRLVKETLEELIVDDGGIK